jgi:hypothetical protein
MELWPIDLLDLNQAERQLLDSCADVEIEKEQAAKLEALLERLRRQERDRPSDNAWAKKSAPPAAFVAARRYY